MDVAIQRLFQRVHHLEHARLALGTERHVDISLPQRLAQFSIGKVDAAFPPRLVLFLSGEGLLHFKICIHERLRKPGRRRVQDMPFHVRLQSIQRFRVQHGIDLLEVFGIRDI